jgi:hypothetical protein
MRKTLLLAATAVLVVAGVAYAASNVYTVQASISPTKSGTSKHPKAIGIHLTYNIRSSDPNALPRNVQKYKTFIQGILEKTNKFKACGTSRLNNPHQGPSTCPKGSKIGSGYAFVQATPSNRPLLKVYAHRCSLQVLIFNGGNHTLSLYLFSGNSVQGTAPCTPKRKQGFVETFTKTSSGLTGTFSIPATFRHVGSNPGTTWTITKLVLNEPVKKKTATHKVKGKTVKTTIGLFDSYSCPSNGQRQVKVTFTTVNGATSTATTTVPCTK